MFLLSSWQQARLRTALIVPFVLQMAAAVGLVGYLSWRSGQRAVEDLATQLSDQVSNRVSERLSRYLATPQDVNEINLQAVNLGMLDLQDYDTTRRFFWKQMQVAEDLGYISFGAPDGAFLGIGRDDDGSLYLEEMQAGNGFQYDRFDLDERGDRTTLLTTETYEFQQDEWYAVAVEVGEPTWSPIYQWDDQPEIISISLNHPVYEDGELSAVLSVDFILSQINDFLQALQVSPNGEVFIIERDGLLVASSSEEPSYIEVDGVAERRNILDLDNPVQRSAVEQVRDRLGSFDQIAEPQLVLTQVAGEPVYVSVMPWQDELGLSWVAVTVIPKSDFLAQINANTRNTVLLSLVALGGAIAICIVTARRLTRPILSISQASEKMAQGNLEQTAESSSIVEINQLAKSFNSMAAQLKTLFHTLEDKVDERTAELATANAEIQQLNAQLKSENLRMKTEIDVARRIQEMILPKPEELERRDDLDIAGFMEPAAEVGGDYYDVLQQEGDRLVTIGIGDVTGHGLESGVIMLMTQTAVRTLRALHETDPVKSLSAINDVLYQNRQRMSSYRNLSLALIDYQDGHLHICGQHEEVLVVRANGTVERVDTLDLGYPVGMLDDISEFIAQHHITLDVGDGIVLYTDGITEAQNDHRQLYGMERLLTIVEQSWHLPSQEIRAAIVEDVRSHIGTHRVYDDITLVVLKRRA